MLITKFIWRGYAEDTPFLVLGYGMGYVLLVTKFAWGGGYPEDTSLLAIWVRYRVSFVRNKVRLGVRQRYPIFGVSEVSFVTSA